MTAGRDEEGADDLDALDESPVIRRIVDKAVAPFVGKVSPEYLSAMRAAIADMLAMHPQISDLVRSLEDRPVRERSDAVAVEDVRGEQASSQQGPSPKKAVGGGA